MLSKGFIKTVLVGITESLKDFNGSLFYKAAISEGFIHDLRISIIFLFAKASGFLHI